MVPLQYSATVELNPFQTPAEE